jgi:predicted phage terminase large subunit-like protein
VKPLILTEADLIAVERELCRRSLADFAKRAWHVLEPGTELKWGWALDAICAHLEAVSRGEVTKLLMNVPPGTMKSLLTGVIWPAWEWGPLNKPHLRVLGTAHKQDLAIRDAMKCRRLIQSAWYQRLWHVALVSDQNAKQKFETAQTGFREAMAFTSMTGARGDRVILDDPISADDANSDAALTAAERTFTEALPTRVNNDQSAIVVIMQRLHERDTSGIILGRELGYVHLCLPMRFEPARRCVTPFYADPRTIDGELLFPERFPEAMVADLERTLGSHATAGQLQQRPAPRGGGIIKTSWFGFYQVAPQIEWRVIFADTAQKTGQENDYSVLECWGRSRTGQAVFLDLVRGKWEAPELLTQARAFWLKHQAANNGPLRAMKVEDKVSGTGLIQTLRREGIPVLAIQRNRDKVSRAHDAAAFIESGNVLLPETAPWLSEFLAEVAAFPSGAHDDQIDPMLDAIREVQVAPATISKPIPLPPRRSIGANRGY